uniref:Uncharacterized protein n=1 Tax=Zea mays TaxID=4577 RepID=C0PFC7_MAIZE|nr:unknown [Zea mays]
MRIPGVSLWSIFTRLFTPRQSCTQRLKAGPGYHRLMLCFTMRDSQEAIILMKPSCW